MNNAKMWLVVHPTVGIPIFLGAVAVSSFAVHVAVLSKTNWYEDYLIGAELGTGEATASIAAPADATTANASYVVPVSGGTGHEVTVILPDGTSARAILSPVDSGSPGGATH